MNFDSIFARNRNAVLQFSGGKDSLACLYLLRQYWSQLTVMWVDTGDAFPETHIQMQAISKLVPNFIIIESFQPQQIEKFGPPVDLLPFWDTTVGRAFDNTRTRKFQSPLACRADNLWMPAMQAVRDRDCTLIVRGQRLQESLKSSIRSGNIEDGIEYLFPIEDWSELQVLDYLHTAGVQLPETYRYFNSSLDCMTCTAFLKKNTGKMRYLRGHHPTQYQVVLLRLVTLADALAEESGILSQFAKEHE